MHAKMFRIAWVNCKGYKSQGSFCVTLEQATLWLQNLDNIEGVQHWIEDYTSPQLYAEAARNGLRKLSNKAMLQEDAFIRLESMLCH
jgi:hypothetical protein